MPIVSRSDCTEITAKEFYKFTFPENYSGGITASLDYVDLDFNACRASRNNNLQRFYERLLNEGRVSRTKYNKFRNTVVGDNQCSNAIEDLLFEKGYQHEAPAIEGWTMLYGRGSMISASSFPELWQNIDAGSYIRRICKSCIRSSHKDIIYKRLTSKGEIDFKDLLLGNWFSDPAGDGKNIRGVDFNLFSSFKHAQDDKNPWNYCNYNDDGVGFPRDCGPTNRVTNEWNSMRKGGESDFAFYLYTGNGASTPPSPAPTLVSPLTPGPPTPTSPIPAPTSSTCGCGPADGQNQPECVGKPLSICKQMNNEGKCKWTCS